MKTVAAITLTTDFGLGDSFVAQMKGVISTISPGVHLLDLCHEIPPFDIEAGARLLNESAPLFPSGTIHLGVVDPGVGSSRRRVIVRLKLRSPLMPSQMTHWLVGPDNGLFAMLLEQSEERRAWEISSLDRLPKFTHGITFDGRNIFAPAAALLATGVAPEELGAEVPIATLVSLPRVSMIRWTPGETDAPLDGAVVSFDRFGNAATNIELCGGALGTDAEPYLVRIDRIGAVLPLGRNYSQFAVGEAGAIVNSQGVIEIVVNQGDARAALGLCRGDCVAIESAR